MTRTTSQDIFWLNGRFSVNELPRFWIPEYHKNPYLRQLTALELQARTEDIISNLMVLGDDRKYRPQFRVEKGIYTPIRNLDFLRMTVELWEELRLRGMVHTVDQESQVQNLQVAKRLADEHWCARQDWVEGSRLSQTEYQNPRMLFKFNETKYNRHFFESGEMFVRPASSYDDSSLNNALLDNELVRKWYSKHGIVGTFSVPDYYCACLASVYDLRLYRDFREREFSCVAINNVSEFINRVKSTVERHNNRNPHNQIRVLLVSPVIYYDPFFIDDMTVPLEVLFTKHFRFDYQREYRLALIPAHSGKLFPVTLNIGALGDIAEFITE